MYGAWLGTLESLAACQERCRVFMDKGGVEQVALDAGRQLKLCGSDMEQNDGFYWPNPVQMEQVGSVLLLRIEGPTFSKTSNGTRYMQMPTYEDIKMQLIKANADPNIKKVLFLVDSPGGMAGGCFAFAEFVDNFSTKLKPIYAYSQGVVASAAIVYSTATNGLMLDQFGEAGSIGAIAVFMEMTGFFQQIGYKPYVFRSGKFKGVPSPYEQMTDDGKEVMEEYVQRNHDNFVKVLSGNIERTPAYINENIADGRVFDAKTAVSLGLAKGIIGFEKLLASLNK